MASCLLLEEQIEIPLVHWLIDARAKKLLFHIHRRGRGAFRRVGPDAEGFARSAVLGPRFRLARRRTAGQTGIRMRFLAPSRLPAWLFFRPYGWDASEATRKPTL